MPAYPAPARRPTGHVYRRDGKRGGVWYAKYRLPDGRQQQRRLGPAWTERGRPPAGYFTKRLAEDWLRDTLDQARRGELPGLVQTGATVADAAAEFLRYIKHDRERKPSTVQGYRWLINAQILPQLGGVRVEELTQPQVERWFAALPGKPSSKRKTLVMLHGIMERARKQHHLPLNPVNDIEKPPQHRGGDIQVLTPEEVRALVRVAAKHQDAAIYMTAAFTGLRMGELIALRWRDIDLPTRGPACPRHRQDARRTPHPRLPDRRRRPRLPRRHRLLPRRVGADGSDIDFYVQEFDEGPAGTAERTVTRVRANALVWTLRRICPYDVDVRPLPGWPADEPFATTMREDSIELTQFLT